MERENSLFEILKDQELKNELQKEILKKCWIRLKSSYSRKPNYYDKFFDVAAGNIFQISSFRTLLGVDNAYYEIWNSFRIVEEFGINESFFPALEFFYNIFCTTILIVEKYLHKKFSGRYWEKEEEFNENFNIFIEFINELEKFLDWVGYSFVEITDDDSNSEYKKYFLMKKELIKIIENANLNYEDKDLMLMLSRKSLKITELESLLALIDNKYLTPQRTNIKKYLGKDIYNDIFTLFNNGLIKHKDSKNMKKLENISEEEKNKALNWLKNIIIFYFVFCRNSSYPEVALNLIKNNKSSSN